MAETTTTFGYTGTLQQYLVPDNVFTVRVVATGGEGNPGTAYGSSAETALGGRSTALVDVTPGETLSVAVGAGYGTTVGGFTPNGATVGRGGPGAGASSHVARGKTRLLVAGGGGQGTSGGGGGDGGGQLGGSGIGYGLCGKGGGADPAWASSDGETSSSGNGGGGWVGGRAGNPNTINANPSGGGGSGKVPAGGTMETGANAGNGSVTITAGVAPGAPTPSSPAAGAPVDVDHDAAFAFVFNGASAKDSQSACQLQFDVGTFDGGTDPVVVRPAGSIAAAAQNWRARTANQLGTWGPWCPWQPFTGAHAGPAPTVTTPADGSTIDAPSVHVSATATGALAWRVQRVADAGGPLGAAVYYDSGALPGGALEVDVDLPVDGRYEHLLVTYRDASGLWSVPDDNRLRIKRARPAVPSAVATAVRAHATYGTDAIDVTITNPTEAGRPAAVRNHVLAGPPGGPLARVNPDPIAPNSTWRWELPAADVDYVIVVQAVTAAGATAVTAALGSPHAGYGLGPYGTTPYGR